MTDENIKQVMQDAVLDADSLERFINGSDSETVLTRLSAEYPTLQKALKELFENGGIAERFKTLADLQASSLGDGEYALVADDIDANNGVYIKESGVWLKSKYNDGKGGLIINRGQIYPLKTVTRNGVKREPTSLTKNLFLDIKVIADRDVIGDKIYAVEYFQNGYTLSHGATTGVRICEHSSAAAFESGEKGILIHDFSDKPLPYSETDGGIRTFNFKPRLRPLITISLTVDLDVLPWGERVAGHTDRAELWSSYIDPSCYVKTASKVKEAPLTNLNPVSNTITRVDASATIRAIFKHISIVAPKDKLEGYVYRIAHLVNGSEPSATGIRVSRHRIVNGGYDADNYEWVHEPTHQGAGYNKADGGDYTFSIPMNKYPDVILSCTLDLGILNGFGVVNSWAYPDADYYHTAVINPANYFATRESFSESGTGEPSNGVNYDIGISGVTSIGASIISPPANDWVERACDKLGILAINKAEGGVGTQNYFANLIWRNGLWTDQEFEDADVLVIQFASSKDLGGTDGLLPMSGDYTAGYDPLNPEDVPFLDMAENMALDYILKSWLERCLAQKDNPESKWFGYKHGKPFRVMFATHWHDARDYYNLPIRQIASRWGAAVCEFDKRIGFSNAVKLPDGTPLSMVYAQDEKSGFGWHPLRGSDGEYVQGRMAGIFYTALVEYFTQL